MRLAVLLLASAATSLCSTAYDCRYFDCVTPFLEGPPVPLPPASSIPQPAAWPGPPLTLTPRRATSTGYVYGWVTGVFAVGPFLSDGTNTFFSSFWPDFLFIDISDSGVILGAEGPSTAFLTTFQGPSVPLGTVFDGGYEYLLGASGRALAMNDAGNAFLLTGVVKWQHLDPSLPLLVESNLTMLWSRGFEPTAIPEPSAAGLWALGSLLGLISLRRVKAPNAPK